MASVTCPICVEKIDSHDRRFFPCPCGFQTCFWCYRKLRDTTNVCPKCRRDYVDENIKLRNITEAEKEQSVPSDTSFGRSSDEEEDGSTTSSSTVKSSRVLATPVVEGGAAKPGKKKAVDRRLSSLRDVRVVRRDLCYLVGLPLEAVADESRLKEFEFFGKYGKVVNIIVNRNPNFKCPDKKRSCAVYITYATRLEAKTAILDSDDCLFEGRRLRASYGTTKYCSSYLRNQRCTNKACFYLHERGALQDSFTVDQLNHVKEQSRNLTCSAILGDELNQGGHQRCAATGVSLFGKSRREVVDYYASIDPVAEDLLVLPSVLEDVVTRKQALNRNPLAKGTPQLNGNNQLNKDARLSPARLENTGQLGSTGQQNDLPLAHDVPLTGNNLPVSGEGKELVVVSQVAKAETMAARLRNSAHKILQKAKSIDHGTATPATATTTAVYRTASVDQQSRSLEAGSFDESNQPMKNGLRHGSDSMVVGSMIAVAFIPEPPSTYHTIVHPALQREWGWGMSSQNSMDWSLKALVSPLSPKDGQVGPPRDGPSRLLKRSCVTSADLTATYSRDYNHWKARAVAYPPGLY
ncbi:RNA recognition motif protein [Gregarina niphandrodes]|uniref:RNA recognition motif protein n=1 Tax=Gregarina niphandrodes TaxID=110365 RepID=A0A023B8U1_GRENI|nr:RNA recognition motif protein [Gregarina niphandrodes]EZG70488.1 RNA recognition motif protein [Gregarina niphandrodes]|eukprot:XP_011129939.1 RNA recognition motif protein [Gregarina niphandrodes]